MTRKTILNIERAIPSPYGKRPCPRPVMLAQVDVPGIIPPSRGKEAFSYGIL